MEGWESEKSAASRKRFTIWIILVQINKFPKFLSEKGIRAPLTIPSRETPGLCAKLIQFKLNHLHDRSTYPGSEYLKECEILEHQSIIIARPRQFIATATFKLQVKGPKQSRQNDSRTKVGIFQGRQQLAFFGLLDDRSEHWIFQNSHWHTKWGSNWPSTDKAPQRQQ